MSPQRTPAGSVPASGNGTRHVDHETRAGADDHFALRLWLRLLSCTNLIEAPLKSRLRERFASSLPRFDLMAQLERHPEGLKMRELSRRLMVTGGNVTGLVDKLVAEGLVERHDHAADGRAWTIRLTPDGQSHFDAMAQEHEAWIVGLFGGLDAPRQALLFELLGELKQSSALAAGPLASPTAAPAGAVALKPKPATRGRR